MPIFIFSQAVVFRFSVEKVFLEFSQNSQENTCARVSFLIKLQSYFKKDTLTQVFSCEFCEISRKAFFAEHLRWLLLYFSSFRGRVSLRMPSGISDFLFYTLHKINKNRTKAERTVSISHYFLHIYQVSFNFHLIFATSFTFHIRTITFKDTMKASFCNVIHCSRLRFE